jgi:ABC-type glycerol-3-phosphate transport system permease component
MKRLILYILALSFTAIFMIPLLWTVSTALKTRQQIFASPPIWIPTAYRAADPGGTIKSVTVLKRIDTPSAEVQLLSGPQSGSIISVEQSALREQDGQISVQLRAPYPIAARIIQEFPDGLAEVRFTGTSNTVYLPVASLRPHISLQWSNFAAAWNSLPLPFHWFLLNTYTITVLNVTGQLLSCSLVAYGFARFRFPGRGPLFLLLLSTMMLPSQVTMIPLFMMWSKAHAVDTFIPLTVPSFFATSAFSVFLLRQFFMGLPRELDEAAMIDGCGPLRIWWQIIMPLSRPALITVGVLAFLGSWDDFLGPLIYLDSLRNYTVSLALRLFQDQYGTDFSLIMAAALVHIVPVVVLFFFAQRYFVKGIAMSGLKG